MAGVGGHRGIQRGACIVGQVTQCCCVRGFSCRYTPSSAHFHCPPVDERLRKECKLLQALGALCCRACGRVLARSADAVQVRPL